MKTLGQLAYEKYSTQLAIGEQLGKGGKIQIGADPWNSLNDRARHLWSVFAGSFASDIIDQYEKAKRSAEAEKERLAMRSDIFEQEVRRRVAEALAESRK